MLLARLFAKLDWRYSPLIVFATAVLAYAWTLPLRFQFDDYWLIPSAGYQLRELGGVLADPVGLVTGTERQLPFLLKHLFQPVLWLMLVIEKGVAGEPLSPALFHASSVLLHGLTAVSLLRLFRHWLELPGALVGALFFAIHPAASQAVSWTGARGDVLVTLFAVLALDGIVRAREKPSWVPGLYLALGLLSKPTLVSMLPVHVVAIFWVLRGAGRRQVVRQLLLVAVPLAAVWIVRSRYLGTWSMVYVAGISPGLSLVPTMIARAPDLVRACLLPWNLHPDARAFAPLATSIGWLLGVAAWVALPALALARDRSIVRRLALGVALAALTAGSALLLWALYPSASGAFMNRALYPVVACLAWLVAVASGPAVVAVTESTWSQRALAAVLVLVLGLSLDALVHVARTELAASAVTSARIAGLEAASAKAGRDTVIVDHDTQVGFAGIPLTFKQIETAMRAPFHEPAIDVRWVGDLPEFVRSDDWLGGIRGPVQVVRWTGETFVAASPKVPAVSRPLPALERDAGRAGAWKPARAVAPRSFRGVRITAETPAPRDVVVRLRADDAVIAVPVHLSAGGSPVIGLDERVEWLLCAELREIVIEPDVEGLRLELVESLPELEVRAPRPQSRLSVLEVPEVVVTELAGAVRLRFDFEVSVFAAVSKMTYDVAVADLASAGGVWRYRPEPGHLVDAGKTLVNWATLPRLYSGVVAKAGVHSLTVVCTVQASDAKGVIARAKPIGFFLVGK